MGSPGAAEGRQVRELVEGLSRRLEEHRRLAERLTGGLGGTDAATLTEAVEDLAATIEELSVAAEELQRGNDMLVAARAEIDEERRRYQSLFDVAPVAYLVTGPDGGILLANLAATTLLGLSARVLRHRSVEDIVVPAHRGRARQVMARLAGPREGPETVELALHPAPARRGEAPGLVPVAARVYRAPQGLDLRWILEDLRGRDRQERRGLLAGAASQAATAAPDLDAGLAAVSAVLGGLAPHHLAVLGLGVDGDVRVAGAAASGGGPAPGPGTAWSRAGSGWLESPAGASLRAGCFDPRWPAPAGLAGYAAWVALEAGHEKAGGGVLALLSRVADAFADVDLDLVEAAGRAALPALITLAALDTERQAAARQREVEEMRSKLFELVVHELRGPLAGIAGLAETLRPGAAGQRAADGLRRIEETARRLDRSVVSILEVGGLEEPRDRSEPRPFDLVALVRRVRDEFCALATDHPVNLIAPPSRRVLGDEFSTGQVLFGLLTNAARFSPPDATIGVGVRSGLGTVIAWVWDRGPGIAEGDVPRLFQRFAVFDDQTAAGPGLGRGHGLGLYLARRLIEAQGGRIWMDRPAQGGARFCFELPRA